MNVLFHALPEDYITNHKFQRKLGGDANKNTVGKLMEK